MAAESDWLKWARIMARNQEPFVGAVYQWEELAEKCGLRATVTPIWKGVGTVLLVVRTADDGPVPPRDLAMFREVVRLCETVGSVTTVVSVG